MSRVLSASVLLILVVVLFLLLLGGLWSLPLLFVLAEGGPADDLRDWTFNWPTALGVGALLALAGFFVSRRLRRSRR